MAPEAKSMAGQSSVPVDRPRWASRVSCLLLHQLYTTDARGITDEELIDKVAYALWERCESIRRVTYRLCHHCAGELAGAFDDGAGRGRKIACAGCGWTSTWGVYHASYKGRRIHGGRAFGDFMQYLERLESARTPREKMLLIDWLIHAVHEGLGDVWTVPAACNLLEGNREEVTRFLNGLGGISRGTPEMRERREQFRAKLEASETATRRFYESRGRDEPFDATYVLPPEELTTEGTEDAEKR